VGRCVGLGVGGGVGAGVGKRVGGGVVNVDDVNVDVSVVSVILLVVV
jgi:hypothetical protein